MDVLYAGIDGCLVPHRLDADAATLEPGGTLDLTGPVEYAWPHPSRPILYVATGYREPGESHRPQLLWTCHLDPRTGAPHVAAPPLSLPARPIYITVDGAGTHLLVAYNNPSGITVHPIAADGAVGPPLPQSAPPDTGIYAHQVRVTPDDDVAIVVARGNSAASGKPEEPGALKPFRLRDGALTPLPGVAPGGGYGFGPRDVDFHPTRPWVYVSLERQNRLQLFRPMPDGLEAEPAFDVSTLENPAGLKPRQLAGTLHVHPSGKVLYVANRADGLVEKDGHKVFAGGENTIAVFAIHPETGAPRLIQSVDAHAIYVRTFSIAPSARILVAASVRPVPVWENGNVTALPAALSVFRIAEDGRLSFVRKYDVDTGNGHMHWAGFVALSGGTP